MRDIRNLGLEFPEMRGIVRTSIGEYEVYGTPRSRACTVLFRSIWYNPAVAVIMENQAEQKRKHETETRIVQGLALRAMAVAVPKPQKYVE